LNAEAILQEREEKLRGIIEGAMDAIVKLDQDFRITMLNLSANKLIGRQNDDINGTTRSE
jgi:PAS domain S-box-containing protein